MQEPQIYLRIWLHEISQEFITACLRTPWVQWQAQASSGARPCCAQPGNSQRSDRDKNFGDWKMGTKQILLD